MACPYCKYEKNENSSLPDWFCPECTPIELLHRPKREPVKIDVTSINDTDGWRRYEVI